MARRLAPVLLLAGCAAGAPAPESDDPPLYYQEATLAYRDCVLEQADAMAVSRASATEVSEAALASCEGEFLAYRAAVTEFFVSSVRTREYRDRARLTADLKAEDMRRALGGMALKRVIQARQK